jgi:hypothetical protein
MYMLTVRYQPNDIQLFEDFISFFLTYILRWKKVVASIEFDGTPDRHLHCIFEDNTSRDRDKIVRYLSKDFKPFMEKLKNKATQIDPKLKTKAFQLTPKYKDDELYWRIGYPLKTSPPRVFTQGFEELEIQEHKNAYLRYIQLENKKIENIHSFTHLTIKTILPQVFDYFQKNKEKVIMTQLGTNIQDLMEEDDYSFIEVSKEKINYVRRLLRKKFYGEQFDTSTFYDDPEITLETDTPKYKLLEEIEFYKNQIRNKDIEIKELQDENDKLYKFNHQLFQK